MGTIASRKILEVGRLGLEPPVRRTDRPAAPPQWVFETHTCVTRASTRRKPCAKESTILGVRAPQKPLPLPCSISRQGHTLSGPSSALRPGITVRGGQAVRAPSIFMGAPRGVFLTDRGAWL